MVHRRRTTRGRVRRRHALALVALVALGAVAQASAKGTPGHAPYFDVRESTARGPGALASPARAEARARLADSIGGRAVVDLDPVTGTPHNLMKLGGYLTGASSAPAADVVMGYVRAHLADLGLAPADLGSFKLADDYADAYGVRHVTWRQEYRGIPVFDNFLRGNVTADGRLINIVGSPLSHVIVRSTAPKISAEAALGTALRDAGGSALPLAVSSRGRDAAMTTRFVGGHRAQLALFGDAGGARLAWVIQAKAGPTDWYRDAIDASDGSLLHRANLVKFATGSVAAWEYHPGSGPAGARSLHSVPVDDGTKLSGIASHVFSDLNDNDAVDFTEDVAASGVTWNYTYSPFAVGGTPAVCTAAAPCTWNQSVSASWQVNRKQNAPQVYYYLNYFHDWLARPQIGFTAAGHNFENADRVVANTDDGANTSGVTNGTPGSGTGFPDFNHTDNANMLTLPDGTSPRMQMYLFPGGDLGTNTPSANGGDDASVVFHEYTHGLSNRLIVDGSGFGALDTIQAASMGEAWSDWYAMDNLVRRGLEADNVATFGNVVLGRYLEGGHNALRSEPMDCRPGNAAGGLCPGTARAGSGGYTYGDMGKICSCGPEVHADGEIWGQTLWQLRDALVSAHGQAAGSDIAEKDITGAMRLSPDQPSMLDQRNALIAADYVYNAHADIVPVVSVLTQRGMGYFASTTNSDDTHPFESMAAWPLGPKNASVSGVVKNDSNVAVAGAKVYLGGHTAIFDVHSTTTDGTGHYTLSNLFGGHTYHVIATKSGFDISDNSVAVAVGPNTRNIALHKDWALAQPVTTDGPDYSLYDCGPNEGVDGSLLLGWSTDPAGTGSPYSLIVTLPQPVNLYASGGLVLAPGASCGDSYGSALAHFRLYTSTTTSGGTWNLAVDQTFPAASNYILQPLAVNAPARNGVRRVKLTMLTNQANSTAMSDYIDMRELKAYGTP